jgi:hypothetical protein
MTRFVRWVCIGTLAGVVGCTVGEVPPLNGSDDDSGEGGGTGGGGGTTGGGSSDGSNCASPVASVGTGNHNPGQDCMNSCHDHGFTVAGTLFTSGTGTTPISGATITIVDSQNTTVTITSQQNGNFYTTTAVVFPITVQSVSECPNSQPMSSPVMPESGSTTTVGCNQSSCHQPGQQGYIHLP